MRQGPEKKLQNKCLAYLKELKRSGGQVWWIKVSQMYGSGAPDVLMCVKGRFLAAELKSEKGVATDLQEKNLKEIGEAGGSHAIIRSEDEFVAFVGKALREPIDE